MGMLYLRGVSGPYFINNGSFNVSLEGVGAVLLSVDRILWLIEIVEDPSRRQERSDSKGIYCSYRIGDKRTRLEDNNTYHPFKMLKSLFQKSSV